MPTRNIIVIGASHGGIEAVTELVRGLPSRLSASLFVVQHVAWNSVNYLSTMFDRETSLTVKSAEDGESIRPGTIYVAVADRHLLIDADQVFLSRGPRENRVRPAVDPLFRSAALSHGERVIGVVLSGALDDGTAGLIAIKNSGGLAVVQDPETAMTPDMPHSALQHVAVDHCLPVAEIGPLLGDLTDEERRVPAGASTHADDSAAMQREVDIMRRGTGEIHSIEAMGELVAASCPDCGGPLWEMNEDFPRFRCHTGHAFTARHLSEGLQEAEEKALYVALRVMEERVRMLKRLAKRDQERGHKFAYESFADKAAEAEEHVRRLRGLLAG